MWMECRFSQTMASEWQTASVVSHKMPLCALLTAVKNYNKRFEKLQDFFFKTETKTKCSRPRLHDPRPRPRLSFLSLRHFETKTLVSRATSLLHTWARPSFQNVAVSNVNYLTIIYYSVINLANTVWHKQYLWNTCEQLLQEETTSYMQNIILSRGHQCPIVTSVAKGSTGPWFSSS